MSYIVLHFSTRDIVNLFAPNKHVLWIMKLVLSFWILVQRLDFTGIEAEDYCVWTAWITSMFSRCLGRCSDNLDDSFVIDMNRNRHKHRQFEVKSKCRWERKRKVVYCLYLRQKWIDLRQTNIKIITHRGLHFTSGNTSF